MNNTTNQKRRFSSISSQVTKESSKSYYSISILTTQNSQCNLVIKQQSKLLALKHKIQKSIDNWTPSVTIEEGTLKKPHQHSKPANKTKQKIPNASNISNMLIPNFGSELAESWKTKTWLTKSEMKIDRWDYRPMRMRRLSGLEEHFSRRRSSVMRSTEGTSSKFEFAIAVSGDAVGAVVVNGVGGCWVQSRNTRSRTRIM